MDIKKIASTLMSSDSISGLSNVTGASKKDVSSVLTAALPSLLGGANQQAKDKDTSAGFAAALSQHAKSDTGNLLSFLGGVDMVDGGKIIGHLLGSGKDSVTKEVSEKSGVSNKNTGMILAAAAPLLMSLLGKQADEDENKDSGVGALFGSLLDNVDLGSLLGGGKDDEEEEEKEKEKKKKKKKTSKKDEKKEEEEKKGGLSGLVGGLFKLLK